MVFEELNRKFFFNWKAIFIGGYSINMLNIEETPKTQRNVKVYLLLNGFNKHLKCQRNYSYV